MKNRFKIMLINTAAHHLLPCRHIVEQLSGPPDKKLPLWKRLVARLHMLNCTWCTNYERQIKLIDNAARTVAVRAEQGSAIEHRLPDDFRNRLKRSMESSSE